MKSNFRSLFAKPLKSRRIIPNYRKKFTNLPPPAPPPVKKKNHRKFIVKKGERKPVRNGTEGVAG